MILTICLLAVALIAVGVMWRKNIRELKAVKARLNYMYEQYDERIKEKDMLPYDEHSTYNLYESKNKFSIYVIKNIGKFGFCILLKSFPKLDDPDFARLQAEELLEKLNEK